MYLLYTEFSVIYHLCKKKSNHDINISKHPSQNAFFPTGLFCKNAAFSLLCSSLFDLKEQAMSIFFILPYQTDRLMSFPSLVYHQTGDILSFFKRKTLSFTNPLTFVYGKCDQLISAQYNTLKVIHSPFHHKQYYLALFPIKFN